MFGFGLGFDGEFGQLEVGVGKDDFLIRFLSFFIFVRFFVLYTVSHDFVIFVDPFILPIDVNIILIHYPKFLLLFAKFLGFLVAMSGLSSVETIILVWSTRTTITH